MALYEIKFEYSKYLLYIEKFQCKTDFILRIFFQDEKVDKYK